MNVTTIIRRPSVGKGGKDGWKVGGRFDIVTRCTLLYTRNRAFSRIAGARFLCTSDSPGPSHHPFSSGKGTLSPRASFLKLSYICACFLSQ